MNQITRTSPVEDFLIHRIEVPGEGILNIYEGNAASFDPDGIVPETEGLPVGVSRFQRGEGVSHHTLYVFEVSEDDYTWPTMVHIWMSASAETRQGHEALLSLYQSVLPLKCADQRGGRILLQNEC